MFGVKDSKNIGDKELNDFKKNLTPKTNGKAAKNGKKHWKGMFIIYLIYSFALCLIPKTQSS